VLDGHDPRRVNQALRSRTLVNNPSIVETLIQILSACQAGLDAECEQLDASALERRKKDDSGKMLSKIKDFFGLNT